MEGVVMTTSKAKSFVPSICDTGFIFVLVCLSYVLLIIKYLFEYTVILSIQLQSSKQDLSMAKTNINTIIIIFKSMQENYYKLIYSYKLNNVIELESLTHASLNFYDSKSTLEFYREDIEELELEFKGKINL